MKVPDGWTSLAFFQEAASANAVIRTLTHDDETLEEFFLRAVSA